MAIRIARRMFVAAALLACIGFGVGRSGFAAANGAIHATGVVLADSAWGASQPSAQTTNPSGV